MAWQNPFLPDFNSSNPFINYSTNRNPFYQSESSTNPFINEGGDILSNPNNIGNKSSNNNPFANEQGDCLDNKNINEYQNNTESLQLQGGESFTDQLERDLENLLLLNPHNNNPFLIRDDILKSCNRQEQEDPFENIYEEVEEEEFIISGSFSQFFNTSSIQKPPPPSIDVEVIIENQSPKPSEESLNNRADQVNSISETILCGSSKNTFNRIVEPLPDKTFAHAFVVSSMNKVPPGFKPSYSQPKFLPDLKCYCEICTNPFTKPVKNHKINNFSYVDTTRNDIQIIQKAGVEDVDDKGFNYGKVLFRNDFLVSRNINLYGLGIFGPSEDDIGTYTIEIIIEEFNKEKKLFWTKCRVKVPGKRIFYLTFEHHVKLQKNVIYSIRFQLDGPNTCRAKSTEKYSRVSKYWSKHNYIADQSIVFDFIQSSKQIPELIYAAL